MSKVETIEEFYKNKFNWIPENLKNELGHFNVFNLEPLVEGKLPLIPYKRRDFYKVMFVKGNSNVHYADKVVEVKKQALVFSNPYIPYKWEHLNNIREGSYCIFNQHFFNQFGSLNQYSVFQPNGTHIFELTDEQVENVKVVYAKMLDEIQSEYVHKYDVLRNLVFELLHLAIKMEPKSSHISPHINGSQRIATLFLELLERQFPIEENHQLILLRTASDFALQLNVHVNHLNRAVKAITQKTTSQLIADRILQESKTLLKQSRWHVSDIAFALGFTEVTHFNNFFKKHTGMSPLKFRNG